MLIEICGVDGSGKSTLIDGTRRRLRESSFGPAYERVLRSESRNLLEAVCLEEGDQVFEARDYELAVLIDALAQAHALDHYRGSTVSHVFITGYRCALGARLEERGFTNSVGLNKLVDRLPAPDLLVFLRVPADIAVGRMRERSKGDSVLEEADPQALVVRRQRSLETWGDRFGAVNLDATMPASVLVDQVVRLIDGWTSATGRHPDATRQ